MARCGNCNQKKKTSDIHFQSLFLNSSGYSTCISGHGNKTGITILLVIIFSTSCEERPFISLDNSNQNKIIAIQSLGDFNVQQLESIRQEIAALFHTPVVILRPVDIPVTYRTVGKEQYSADSLIMFLLKFTSYKIVDVVGVTHEDICTMHKYQAHEKNWLPVLYEPADIFGYGYVSGNSCIVSDYRLQSSDQELSGKRLIKMIIHEIGNNPGLPHCSNDTCIMFEGDMRTLDKCNGNYCIQCRRLLN